MNETLQSALAYLAAGRSIIPCQLPEKCPVGYLLPTDEQGRHTWEPYQRRLATTEEVQAWHENGREHAIGLVCGKVSGNFEVIDVDDRETGKRWVERIRDLDPGLIDRLALNRTPSGLYHVGYCCSEISGNQKLAIGEIEGKRKTLIETRGEGGYVLVPPSKGYESVQGTFENPPTITPEERELLLAAARFFDQSPAPPPAEPRPERPRNGGLLAGDDYNTRGDWREVLQRDGWALVRSAGDKEEWRRPGKKHGNSATWNHDGSGVFYVFSSNAYPFEPEQGYSPFAIYAHLECGGDYTEAARRLSKEGYGDQSRPEQPPPLGDEEAVRDAFPANSRASEGSVEINPLRALKGLDFNDEGNAQAFAILYGDRFRFYRGNGKWYRWAAHFWEPESGSAPYRAMVRTLREREKVVASMAADAKGTEVMLRFLRLSRNTARVSAALTATATLPRLEWTSKTELDADPWLLATPNGVLDLKTGSLSPGKPAQCITRAMPYPYDADAECPRWESFLSEIFAGDDSLVAFVQRAIGYSLTGRTEEQCFFLCWGTGANGKTVFLSALLNMFGEQGRKTPFSTLESHRGERQTNDIAALVGRRLVVADESQLGQRLDESRVKALTGGDAISVRLLRKEFFTYTPAYKIWLATNHKPNIRGTDHGMWRRVRLIPFEVRFDEENRDPQLADKLKSEATGILAWAVRGCLEWQRIGLDPPAKVLQATEAYRKEMNIVGQFLDECTERAAGESVKAKDIYRSYDAWCKENGERPMTNTRFGKLLRERGLEKKKQGGCNHYLDLRCVGEDEAGWSDGTV